MMSRHARGVTHTMVRNHKLPIREDYITVAQAAEEYGMGESTVWLLIKRHDLDRYRMPGQGKKTFIRREDLERAYQTPVPIKSEAKKEVA